MKLRYIGKSCCPSKGVFAHRHSTWELVYTEKGSGRIAIDGVVYPFEENSIMLYPPQTTHQKTANTPFVDYYFLFSGCELQPDIYVFRDTQDGAILQLMKLMYRCYHETKQLSVCDSLGDAVMGLLAPVETDIDKNVRQLCHILAANFTDPDFKVADAMAQIPLNEDYLRRRFKQEMGRTPQSYLTHLRVENAKKLLSQSSGMLISEVAFHSGFYEPLYFSRVFRKYTGCAPQAWEPEAKEATPSADSKMRNGSEHADNPSK